MIAFQRTFSLVMAPLLLGLAVGCWISGHPSVAVFDALCALANFVVIAQTPRATR